MRCRLTRSRSVLVFAVPPGRSGQLEDISCPVAHAAWGDSAVSKFKYRLFKGCLLTEISNLVDADILCLILDFSGDRYRRSACAIVLFFVV